MDERHLDVSEAGDGHATPGPTVPVTPSADAGRAASGQDVPNQDTGAETGGAGGRHDPRLALLALGIGLLVLVLDQVTKYLAVKELTGRAPIELIGEFLQLRLTRNSGAAFSFATGMTGILSLIALTISVVMIRYIFRLGSRWWALALGLMLGGAIGNLLDRFFREPGFMRGHVVDFIAVPHYPIFNVADSAVVCGAVLIAVLGFVGIGLDGRRHRG